MLVYLQTHTHTHKLCSTACVYSFWRNSSNASMSSRPLLRFLRNLWAARSQNPSLRLEPSTDTHHVKGTCICQHSLSYVCVYTVRASSSDVKTRETAEEQLPLLMPYSFCLSVLPFTSPLLFLKRSHYNFAQTFHVPQVHVTSDSGENGHFIQKCVFVPLSCMRRQQITTEDRIIFFVFTLMHTSACTNKCNHAQMNWSLVLKPCCQHQYQPLLSLSHSLPALS